MTARRVAVSAPSRTVLICGAGIAGPTLAYWLLRHGFEPTLVERAPTPRTEGYMIDFLGEALAAGTKVHATVDS